MLNLSYGNSNINNAATPVKVKLNIAIDVICDVVRPNTPLNAYVIATDKNIAMPLGNVRFNTLGINLPVISALFGFNASKNDEIPITKNSADAKCCAWNGKLCRIINHKMVVNTTIVVFIKNSEALF